MRACQLDSHEEYNEEPVIYCKDCLSLRIMEIGGTALCDDCGSTEFEEANIRDWEKLFESKYGYNFLNNK